MAASEAQAAGEEGQTKLLDLCSGALLKRIGANADKLTATFCYGGAVDIPSNGLKLFYMQTKNDTSQAKVLDIPLQGGREEDFLDLLSACEEATFERRKEDVLDPSYRKALKLGKDYSCTFNLSEYSILSEVQRVMAPDALGIRAELHKLNVYRTGDFFKSHVDTPRREDMFASLVVCLPFEHEGEELHIRHGSVTSVIDWSSKSGSVIQWAALYSDCEHEVKEVTRDYRVTLTYNLYADTDAPAPERPFGASSDVRHVPLCQTLVEALGQQSFLYDGGRLGFMCQHRYPHTSHAFAEQPAPLLKGADAVLFAVAKALGLHVRFVHLYKLEAGSNKEEEQMGPLSIPGRDYGDCDVPREEFVRADDLQLQADGFKPVSEISGAVTRERFTKGHVSSDYNDRALVDVLTPMSGVNYVESWTNLCKTNEFRRCFTSMEMERQKDIQWSVSETRFWDVGKFSPAYGNECCVNYFYCAAAMLVSIPKWGQDRHKVFERLAS